jgi:hypothetical protein
MKACWLCAGLVPVLFGPSFCAGAAPANEPPSEARSYQVPYTLSLTKHILVRAKINDKGPFHFVLDTGAPFLFVSSRVCRKQGIEADRNGWGNFKRIEVEGGAVVADVKGRIDDPYQLEGMNGLALAGVELHGIIGYNVLARYRVTIDFTRDRMTWTEIDYVPPAPLGMGQALNSPAAMDALGGAMKLVGTLLGRKPNSEVKRRGALGLELRDDGRMPTVQVVLAGSPAERAGIRAGDQISHFQGKKTSSSTDLCRLAAKKLPGQEVRLTIVREGHSREITVTTGEGF